VVVGGVVVVAVGFDPPLVAVDVGQLGGENLQGYLPSSFPLTHFPKRRFLKRHVLLRHFLKIESKNGVRLVKPWDELPKA
jgi:hypothetical protein